MIKTRFRVSTVGLPNMIIWQYSIGGFLVLLAYVVDKWFLWATGARRLFNI